MSRCLPRMPCKCCRRGPEGPIGPTGPTGPVGPPGPSALQWNLMGPLQGYPTDTTVVGLLPGDGGVAIFDGVYFIDAPRTIQQVQMTQRTPGTSGTTSGELLRWRAGTFTSISILDITSTAPLSSVAGSISDPNLLSGDLLLSRLRSIQNGTPANLSLQVSLGSP